MKSVYETINKKRIRIQGVAYQRLSHSVDGNIIGLVMFSYSRDIYWNRYKQIRDNYERTNTNR